jgi:hypothetical protein
MKMPEIFNKHDAMQAPGAPSLLFLAVSQKRAANSFF